jgi:hypothetical protein
MSPAGASCYNLILNTWRRIGVRTHRSQRRTAGKTCPGHGPNVCHRFATSPRLWRLSAAVAVKSYFVRSSPARPARVRRSCSVTVCSVLHRLQRHRCSAPTPRQGQHPQGPHRGRPRRASRTLCSPVRPRNGRPNGLPGCSARPCAPLLRCLLRERGAARWLTCSLRRDYRPLAMVGA